MNGISKNMSDSGRGHPSAHGLPARARLWAGRVLSGLTIATLLADAAVQMFVPGRLRGAMAAIDLPPGQAPLVGMILLVCTLVYAVPRTAMLGAILLTGFLGGAIGLHFRIGEIGSRPQLICLMLGAMAWGALYLRDARLRALLR